MRVEKQPYLSHQSHKRVIFWDLPLSGEMLLLRDSNSRKGFPTIAISYYLRVCPWMPIQYFQTFRYESNIRGA
jgi:hypothetical protein